MQERHGYGKGFIQEQEEEKRLPTPFRMLASVTRLTNRENVGAKGASAFTPHPRSPQAGGREERMTARGRLVAPRVPQLVGPSKNESFTGAGGWSSVENLAHRWRAAVCPSPPTPNIQYFLLSEKQVGSWAAAELPPGALCCQRASSCSSLF